ncbi:MAG: hypothetical protein R3A10_09500 [Caldilineaceae bacterium]
MSPSPQRYPILAGPHRAEEEIKRSRFITTIDYAPTVDAARAMIAAVSAEFADAPATIAGPIWSARPAARGRSA